VAFTLTFIKNFSQLAYLVGPIAILLLVMIVLLGQIVGRVEGWSKGDAVYYAFITATTVGYGDFHPKQNRAKVAAVAIALLGLLLTGIIVATGLQAIELTITSHYSEDQLRDIFDK